MRHAQSEANLKDILASRKDYELTEQGQQDAALIASELKQLAPIDTVISSPLLRAQQTAAPIAEAFGLDIQTEAGLIEQELGTYSGMTYEALEQEADYMHDRAARWDWIPAGNGESYQMIAERVQELFEKLNQYSGDHILLVTHAVTLRLIKATLEQTLPNYPLEIAKNGEIWKIQFTKLGDTHVVESIFLGGSKSAASRA